MSSTLPSMHRSDKHPFPDADTGGDPVKKVKTQPDKRSILAAANLDACIEDVKKDMRQARCGIGCPNMEGNDLPSDGTMSNASHDEEVNAVRPTSRHANHVTGSKQDEKRPIFSVGQSCTVVSMLPRVPEMSLSFGEDSPSLVIPFMLKDVLKGDEEKAE
ncbi:uncharacterized protein ARMOST_21899 [Armillaria ostoyae]|uniref:Uncharacterized protein n=1 Tax=Armillaria ostoyae TaxID=47428 RepID=A0A284SBC0_ARMOS|nr:uncharacterized protein ARMOST_21899 [Armillaria ostoyae]